MSESSEYLPDAPEEPLPSDCCGGGCVPCVMDIYHEQLEQWLHFKAMPPDQRAKWKEDQKEREKWNKDTTSAVSLAEYRTFTIEKIDQVSGDCFVFTFGLPSDTTLGLQVGQHLVLRYIVCVDQIVDIKVYDIILRVQESSGSYISRQYTPVSPLKQIGSFQVLIKVE